MIFILQSENGGTVTHNGLQMRLTRPAVDYWQWLYACQVGPISSLIYRPLAALPSSYLCHNFNFYTTSGWLLTQGRHQRVKYDVGPVVSMGWHGSCVPRTERPCAVHAMLYTAEPCSDTAEQCPNNFTWCAWPFSCSSPLSHVMRFALAHSIFLQRLVYFNSFLIK